MIHDEPNLHYLRESVLDHTYFNMYIDHMVKRIPIKTNWIYENKSLKMAFWLKGGIFIEETELTKPISTTTLRDLSREELLDIVHKVESLVRSLTDKAQLAKISSF